MKKKYTVEELSELLKEYGTVSKDWDGEYLCSERWIRSGISYDWYGNKQNVGSEKPKKFVELHKFLKDKFPYLTYMEFVEIEDNCVDTYNDHESDYYSDLEVTYWRCSIEKLAECLPLAVIDEFEMVCGHCGKTFTYEEGRVYESGGGLMGEFDAVDCPYCGHQNEHYEKEKYPNAGGGYVRLQH